MRSRFLVKAIALCAVVSSAVFAQQSTARIDALSKTLIYKDPYLMLNDPVEMFYYEDIIQATYGDTVLTSNKVGPIFATRRLKSAENFMIGFIANRTDNVWSDFYNSASNQLDSIRLGAGSNRMPNVPHLLLGVDLEFMTLALDLNYEFLRYNDRTETSVTDTTQAEGSYTTETISKTSERVGTPGVKISSDILLGDELKLGIGGEIAFPDVKVFSSTETTRSGNVPETMDANRLSEITVSEESGIRVRGFADVATELFGVTWKTGIGILYDTYRLQQEELEEFPDSTFDTTFTLGDSQKSRVNPYFWLGGLKEIQPGLVGGFSYRFDYILDKDNPDSLATDDDHLLKRNISLEQAIRGGIEKSWAECWRFDEVFARAGISYLISTGIYKATSDGEQNLASLETRTKDATTFGEMDFTLGSGIRKGIFLFDFVVNKELLSNIIPVITGSNTSAGAFAKFTITLDFKHRTADCCPKPCEGGSSMMRSTPASTPSYGGQQETEERDTDFSF